jgi:FkbM family methyltransferase
MRPFSIALIKRKFQSLSFKRNKKALKKSFLLFKNLTELEGIDNLTFKNGLSLLELSDGRKFWFDPLPGDASSLFSLPFTGEFEKKETDIVRRLIANGSVCVDAGANFGYYTTILSEEAGPDGAVHAFEPLAHTFKILERNLEANNINNTFINELALDEMAGKKEIFLPDIGISGSFKLHRYKKSYNSFQINAESLDSYARRKNINSIDFIKADIEGAELLLIKGSDFVLKSFKPILFIEIQKTSTQLFGYEPIDLIELINDYGYSARSITKCNTL